MIPTPWQWQFPPLENIPSFRVQLSKVHEEFNEVTDAYFSEETPERLAEELMDLNHSVEQALRRLEVIGVDLNAVKRGVIEKNDARGYYGDGE